MARGRRPYPKRYPRRRSRTSTISIRSYIQVLIPMLLAGVFTGSGYWGWKQLMKPDTLPFHHIEIIAKEAHIKSSVLKKIAWENLQGGFFSLKVNKLEQGMMAVPWVADIALRRDWPDTLAIIVTEQMPVARWGNNGVVNDQGEIFFPSEETIPRALPILNGPVGAAKKIVINYQKIRENASLLGLGVKSLNVSLRLSYRVVLSNGLLVIIGRKNIAQRFNRIVELYPRLIGQKSGQVAYVDLRYSNGLAIKWKTIKK